MEQEEEEQPVQRPREPFPEQGEEAPTGVPAQMTSSASRLSCTSLSSVGHASRRRAAQAEPDVNVAGGTGGRNPIQLCVPEKANGILASSQSPPEGLRAVVWALGRPHFTSAVGT